MRSVLAKSWHDKKRSLLGWLIGIVGLVLLTVLFWPAMRDNEELKKALEGIPEEMQIFVGEDELTSPTGYLDSQLFLYTIPILFLIYGIGRGADAIAGEEKRHTIDLLLSHPITRGRVILEKFGAICLGMLVMTVALFVSTEAGIIGFDMELGADQVAAACVGLLLLGMVFAAFALLLGASSGKKGVGIGVASAAATVGYFINGLAPQVEGLQQVRKLTPFYYYSPGSPLKGGFDLLHLGVLAAGTAVFLFAAVWFFDRRDVDV